MWWVYVSSFQPGFFPSESVEFDTPLWVNHLGSYPENTDIIKEKKIGPHIFFKKKNRLYLELWNWQYTFYKISERCVPFKNTTSKDNIWNKLWRFKSKN